MTLTERHEIKRGTKEWKILDRLLFLSKNLYNATLYEIRQEYFKTKKYLNYYSVQKILQDSNNPNYRALPSKVSQAIVKGCSDGYESFFNANEDYKKNKGKYKAAPKMPGYIDKINGRHVLTYTNQAVSVKELRDNHKIKLSGVKNISIPTSVTSDSLCCVRVVPGSYNIVVEVVYKIKDLGMLKDNLSYAAIDLGVNNLATVSSNETSFEPFIISGKPVKSFNQYYNKRVAKETPRLKKVNGKNWSIKLSRISHKRDNKISDYFHKASRYIVNQLVDNNINTLIIGKNNGWKQDTSMGKVNNQKFVMIPYEKLIQKLVYKCALVGITVIVVTEEYTSKCSFLDQEVIGKHDVYLGKRVHRGLFKSSQGKQINADLNGSLNILRKCKPNAFDANGVVGVVVHPKIISYDRF